MSIDVRPVEHPIAIVPTIRGAADGLHALMPTRFSKTQTRMSLFVRIPATVHLLVSEITCRRDPSAREALPSYF
jgi:hypothetical protein